MKTSFNLIKGIILTNAIELDLPSMVKIHLVVNISRVCRYKDQVKDQGKEQPAPVIIEGEEEYEVEKILITNGHLLFVMGALIL